MTTETSLVSDEPTPNITRTWSCVLFDLDGTLTDSAPGIVSRLAKTFEKLGRPVPSDAELLAWVGPPLLDSFENVGFTPDEARAALDTYRGISAADGPWSGAAVYPGIAGLVRQLNAAGVPIAVASSKPESQVEQVLGHFGLEEFFIETCGASEDETRSEKAAVIEETLRRLRQKNVDLSRLIYVGDRYYDVEGAAAHGIPSIIVEWGYGSPAEAKGAMAVVHSADQLAKLLIG